MDVVLHVPQVAELVFRAGGGPAGLRRLHRKAAEHQAFGQLPQRFEVSVPHAGWIGHRFPQTPLDDGPSRSVNGFHPEGVRHQPVGPRSGLRQ